MPTNAWCQENPFLLASQGLYEFPVAAVTNDHKLGGLKQQFLLSEVAGNPGAGGMVLLPGALRETPALCPSFWSPLALLNLWPCDCSAPYCGHTAASSSVCVSVCVQWLSLSSIWITQDELISRSLTACPQRSFFPTIYPSQFPWFRMRRHVCKNIFDRMVCGSLDGRGV